MIELGSKCRDRMTGFEGIAIGRHEYLYGCTRFSVQPLELKDGKPQESQAFDEPQLEVFQVAAFVPVRPQAVPPGGPRDDLRRTHSVDGR